ncbi:hypothetical protein FACS1894161_0590 [Spirochaetia bacterium]|nr:hypothetical protein FACS1894161_0590 [Spirochaetia bacterium]
MTIEQTVEMLTIDVPREIPEGGTILAFTPAWESLAACLRGALGDADFDSPRADTPQSE